MKLLTAIEWARAGKPASHLSLPPRETGHRREMILWLQAHPGSGWFYVSGDNFYFGAAGDAAAFRRWVSAAQPVG